MRNDGTACLNEKLQMRKAQIKLRAMEPEDLDVLYQIENDSSVWNVGVTNVPYSRYVLRDYIAQARNDIYMDGQVRLMIEDEEGGVVGIADIVNFNPQHQRAEVSIVITADHRHQGYAATAMAELSQYALRVLHLHQLYAVVDADNKAALSLFLSAGFHESSRLEQWLFDGRAYHDAVLFSCIL